MRQDCYCALAVQFMPMPINACLYNLHNLTEGTLVAAWFCCISCGGHIAKVVSLSEAWCFQSYYLTIAGDQQKLDPCRNWSWPAWFPQLGILYLRSCMLIADSKFSDLHSSTRLVWWCLTMFCACWDPYGQWSAGISMGVPLLWFCYHVEPWYQFILWLNMTAQPQQRNSPNIIGFPAGITED